MVKIGSGTAEILIDIEFVWLVVGGGGDVLKSFSCQTHFLS